MTQATSEQNTITQRRNMFQKLALERGVTLNMFHKLALERGITLEEALLINNYSSYSALRTDNISAEQASRCEEHYQKRH